MGKDKIMDEQKVKRINELYRKSKAEGLTEKEKKEQQISVERIVIGESTEEKKQEISQDYSTLRNELAQLLHITISCVEVKQKSR